MASNTFIITHYLCAANGCHNEVLNRRFSFCEPCYRVRIATQRHCSSCHTAMVNVRVQKPMRYLARVYCQACTDKHQKKIQEDAEQRKQQDMAEQLARKKADIAAHFEAERIAREKEKEIQRVKDEKMQTRIGALTDYSREELLDMICVLYKQLDVLKEENEELKEYL